MTLIDALAGLQEGALPTNEQTIAFLSQVIAAFPQQKELSESGRGLVSDSRSVFEALERIVAQRNGGEELQHFLWRTRGAAGQLGKDGLKFRWGGGDKGEEQKGAKKENAKNSKSSTKQKFSNAGQVVQRDAVQATQHIRTLLRLALVQPELRHIVADVGYMFAEVVDKSTGTSIEEARTQLGQVKSATGTFQNIALKALNSARAQKLAVNGSQSTNGNADGTRLDALKQLAQGAASEMPALSDLREHLSATFSDGNISIDAIRQELSNGRTVPALEELRKQAELQAGKVAKGKDDLERMRSEIASGKIPPEVIAALSGSDEEAPKMVEENDKEIKSVNGDALLSPTDLLDAAQMIAVANQKFKLAPASTVQEIIQTTKDNAKDSMKEAWTKERQERLLNRSKKLIVDCQVSKDYKEAVEWFIERIETFTHAAQSKVELPSTSLDSALSSAAEPLIKLVENFAGGLSLRSILETAKRLSIGAKDDEKIRSFWTDADTHLRRCLLEEGFVLTKEAEQGIHELVKRFHSLQSEYKSDIAKLIRQGTAFVEAVSKDALIKELLSSAKNVIADLTFGKKDGVRLPSRDLLRDLRQYILPALFKKFGVIPVPRIKYLHPDFDLVIENIAIELKYLLPDIFDFKMTNDVHLDFRKIKDSSHAHSFKIKIKGMSIRVYKLAFAITTRFGIKFHDHGIADLLIADFGVSIYIDIPKDPGPHYFLVKKVKAKLGKLQLKIYESNHRILHSLAGGLANSYLTKGILRHFIGMGITIGLKELDVKLMAMRLNKDSDQGKITVEEVRKQMAELRDLLKKYHEQAGSFEIDFTREDSKGIGKSIEDSHAVKWVKKQVNETGKKEIVRNEWRSNAFDLDGSNTIKAMGDLAFSDTNAAKPVDGAVEETEEAAEIRMKPEGPTDTNMIRKASDELRRAEEEEAPKRKDAQDSDAMGSNAGKEAVGSSSKRGTQTGKLEAEVNRHA